MKRGRKTSFKIFPGRKKIRKRVKNVLEDEGVKRKISLEKRQKPVEVKQGREP